MIRGGDSGRRAEEQSRAERSRAARLGGRAERRARGRRAERAGRGGARGEAEKRGEGCAGRHARSEGRRSAGYSGRRREGQSEGPRRVAGWLAGWLAGWPSAAIWPDRNDGKVVLVEILGESKMVKLQEGKLKNGDDASRLLQVGTYAAARVAALEALEKRLGGNLANASSGAHGDKHDSEEIKTARLWRSDKAEQETTTKDPAAAAAAAAEKLERKAATNIWQRPLARHMQRRTRSHQSRKMPVKRRLKRQHADVEELDTRKARRGRREFFRNEPRTVSHLWAVKRLHMGEPFGFSGRPVAMRSQEHGLRFTLDASKHGCMVHDCSYLRWARVPFETPQAWIPKGEARLRYHDYTSKSLEFHDGAKGPAMLYPGNQGKGYLLVAHRPDASLPLDEFEDASMSLTLFRLRGDRSHEVLGAALGSSLAESSGATRDTWRALFGPQRTIHAPRHVPPGVMLQLRVHNANVLALKLAGKNYMEPDASSIVQDPATLAKKLAKENMSLESGIEADTISEQETLLTLVRHHDNSWDLIIASPRASGVARNLWVLLVHAGASAAGWEEERAATLASGRPLFPDDFPETEAFSKYWKAQEATHVAVNMKRPRGKRIASPYDALVQHEYGRDDQAFCTIELRLRQPQGCRARVDVGAKVFMVLEDEYEAVVKKGQTPDVDMRRDPVGFVTSALGRTRVRASSLVSSPGRASGRGFIQLAKLAKDRENFVLVQNPGTEALALGRVTCVREKC